MVDKDDDLGLSLALKCPETQPQRPLNLFLQNTKKVLPGDVFHASETRAYLRGIDVNRAPAMADCEDVGVSSPNSTISSISGKRNDREANDDDNENENEMESSEEDAGGNGDAVRKKLRLSKEQSAILEETFKEHNTLNPKQKLALAKRLNLRPRQVEVWFQNRRARTKLKQTEVDCEYLKRCCENLTEENRRLQKEVQELRTLKLSPQLYMHMNPPTTLTMCPSCERVAVTSSAPASAPAPSPSPTPAPLAATTQHFALGPHQHRPMPMPMPMPMPCPWAGGAASSMRHRPLDAHGTRS